MQFRNMEFTDIDTLECSGCNTLLGNVFTVALARSESELLSALEEFVEHKSYGVHVKDKTLKIMCPTCLVRAKGQIPLEDVAHKLSITKPTESTTEDE